MADAVKIIECPRDAWQGLPVVIPAATKVQYLRALIGAGFKHIDAVSFVSPKAVPQMADAEEVLRELDPPDDVELIGIVVNEQGIDRAIASEAVQTVGFPYSISQTFLERNQKQTFEAAIDELEKIQVKAFKAGIDVVAYISMAFGNPYGDVWTVDEVLDAVDLLADQGIQQISLADTIGHATAEQLREVLEPVYTNFDYIEIGVHLHSRPGDVAAKVLAAYDAGCRRFDSAIGGLGGCPFAQDELVANLPTEAVLEALKARTAQLPIRKPIDTPLRIAQDIATKFSAKKVS